MITQYIRERTKKYTNNNEGYKNSENTVWQLFKKLKNFHNSCFASVFLFFLFLSWFCRTIICFFFSEKELYSVFIFFGNQYKKNLHNSSSGDNIESKLIIAKAAYFSSAFAPEIIYYYHYYYSSYYYYY